MESLGAQQRQMNFARNINGIRLHYIEEGSGWPVVFLHGFPDFSYSWRHQFATLSKAGYRCIAPDLRGYNESDKPPRVSDYSIDELVKDIEQFVGRVAGGNAFVVGHDWGGVIAWQLAMRHPARVRKLVIINAPHPATFRRELKKGGQLLRSWYAAAFQIPALPELVLSSLHYHLLTRAAARNEADQEIYEEALSKPGVLTSALNYYRAAFRRMLRNTSGQEAAQLLSTPTLVLWGERDHALSNRLLDGLEQYVAPLEIIRYPDLGHWAHIDGAERVNAELMRFLQ